MAATYGYGGEFSSDEDIDRIEASQQESKFLEKRELESLIDNIRNGPAVPADLIQLNDDQLARLLEYFKTQRGPIVDSTRALYKKIVIRLIRGELPSSQPSNGDSQQKDSTNGLSNNNNTVEQPDAAHKLAATKTQLDSSDDDEPMPPADTLGGGDLLGAGKKKFDPRVVYSAPGNNVEPMEVDTDAAREAMMMRLSKQVDLSSSDDNDDDQSETEESSDEEDSHDSEVLDVTPIKPVSSGKVVTHATSQRNLAAPTTKSSGDFALKKRVTTSTPNKVNSSEVKKPYTRSQRVTTRATSSAHQGDKTASATKQAKEESATTSALGLSAGVKIAASKRASRVKFVLTAAMVIVLAMVLYYFRSNLKKSTDHIVRGIKF